MSYWIITGQAELPVAQYVTLVVSEDETDDPADGGQPLHRWVVEACEGQIQKVITDPRVVRVTWERR